MRIVELIRCDLRYAFRTLIRNPAFTLIAVFTMAVGIGATTAIFSIVDSVLLRPLPFSDPDALVLVSQANRQTRESSGDATPANFLDWRSRNRTFAGLSAYRNAGYTLSSGGRPDRVAGAMVNSSFFDVLGVKPILGRGFQPGDEGQGAARVAIVSAALWKQRFGARIDIVGQMVRLNDEPHTVIGVAPPGIDFPGESHIWTPPHWRVPDDPLALNDDPSAQRNHGYLFVLGRIRPEASRAQAQRDMDAVAAGLERDYPNDNRNVGVVLTSLHDELVGSSRPTLMVLFAAVVVLLLIATANVSGLLMARATVRHQEMAIRVALGATRRRILGQLLTESVLLAAVGGACGVILAMWMVAPLAALAPQGLSFGAGIRLDVRVLLFAVAASTFAGILFGLAPARQLMRVAVHEDLKQTARGGSGARQRRVRAALVAAEIALTLVLLVAAGLVIKSLIRLQRVPTGFDTDRVLTLNVSLPQLRYPAARQRADFWEHAIEGLKTLPAVETVGATSRLPLSGGNSTRGITIDGQALTPPASADYRTASPEYFRALGIPLLGGRPFRDDDRENRQLVALVSRSMAKRYWPEADPIGRQLSIDGVQQLTVVGIVGDVHHASLEAAPQPTFYVPYRQDAWPSMTFVLRTAVAPNTLAASARAAIWQLDKDQPVGSVRTMGEQLSLAVAQRRFSVALFTAFGAIALALAAIGLYGVLAFVVAQRRREIGVRMALGARPADVIVDVIGHGLCLTGVGIAAGLALALTTTRLINALLFGTSATDVATFVTVAILLVVVAAAASLVPAFRASRLDPIVALREE
jgi:putative ABC transport system permease protein